MYMDKNNIDEIVCIVWVLTENHLVDKSLHCKLYQI